MARGEDALPSLEHDAIFEDDHGGPHLDRQRMPKRILLVADIDGPAFAQEIEVPDEALAVAAPVGAEEDGDPARGQVGRPEARAGDLVDDQITLASKEIVTVCGLPAASRAVNVAEYGPGYDGVNEHVRSRLAPVTGTSQIVWRSTL